MVVSLLTLLTEKGEEMKRLFVVDYKENGESKHQCIETEQYGDMTDNEVIAACHAYVGIETELDSVIEVLSYMTAEDLEKIALLPAVLFLPRRPLYVNIEEVQRCAELLRGVK